MMLSITFFGISSMARVRIGPGATAFTVTLTRTSADSGLRRWGVKLREKVGFKRAAVARKLAVIMRAMLKTGQAFDWPIGLTEQDDQSTTRSLVV